MSTLNQHTDIQREASLLVNLIMRELILEFDKTEEESLFLIRNSNVYESILKEPIGLHDSPHQWALIVLTHNNDVDALEKYYH
jgi:hypothetical protein